MEIKKIMQNITSGALVTTLTFSPNISSSETGDSNFCNFGGVSNSEVSFYTSTSELAQTRRITQYVEKNYPTGIIADNSVPNMQADFLASIQNLASQQVSLDSDMQKIMDQLMISKVGKGPKKSRFLS